MKMREKKSIRYAVKLIVSSLVFTLAVIGLSAAAFAEGENETTQTVYIGGNMLVVSSTEGSFWYYNETDGTITESDEDNANIIINDEKKYYDDNDDGEMYMAIKNVNITSRGQSQLYFADTGIFSIVDELYLRVYGDCKVYGAEYGIYANYIHISGQNKEAKLTVTADGSLARPGTIYTQSEAMHLKKRGRILAGDDRTDFSLILRSTTNNTIYGAFTLVGSKHNIYTSADIDGANPTKHYIGDDGYYHVGDRSQFKYVEYRVGTELYDKVEITDAKLTFNAGDKPEFTAKLGKDYEDKFLLWEEQWALLDENGNKVKWCSSVTEYNPTEENLLTEFEEGKTYYYSVTVSIKNFFYEYADDVTVIINGNPYNYDQNGHSAYTIYMKNFINMTPAVKSDTVIDKIEIRDAVLSYADGGKPAAAAVTSGKYKDNYEIAYEYWEEMKQNSDGTLEPVAFWYSDENMYTSATKKFTEFEAGKKYMYSVSLKAKDGYRFADRGSLTMTLNGNEVDSTCLIPSSDGKTVLAVALKTININKTEQHSHSYDKWSYDTTAHWMQCTDSNCDDLNGSIKDKSEHVYESDKDTVCDICGYERKVEDPGNNKPEKPGDSNDNKPEDPDSNKPTVPGESEDVKPGECSGEPIVNPETNGGLNIAAVTVSALLLTGALILRKKR